MSGGEFKAEASGQVDLEGRRAESPITRKETETTTYTYKNAKAKVAFTESTITKECIDPPADKDVKSIRQFVQDRIKWISKSPLTGEEMQALVEQFEKVVRADFVR